MDIKELLMAISGILNFYIGVFCYVFTCHEYCHSYNLFKELTMFVNEESHSKEHSTYPTIKAKNL